MLLLPDNHLEDLIELLDIIWSLCKDISTEIDIDYELPLRINVSFIDKHFNETLRYIVQNNLTSAQKLRYKFTDFLNWHASILS